jgi:DNA-binding Xre family transcriptional regulator
MADLEAGTVGGRLELDDKMSESISTLLRRVSDLETKFGSLDEATKKVGRSNQEAASGVGELKEAITGFALGAVEAIGAAELISKTFQFASVAIENAARLEDLSKATGIATDDLQRMGYVGKEVGVDIEQMSRAVENLGMRLANGDKNAAGAVERLGLNVEHLKAIGIKEAFIEVTDAAGKLEDPMMKDAVVAELFGNRVGRQLLPLLGELREKMAQVPSEALISDATIQKAHEFEVGLDHLRIKAESVFVEGLSAWQDGAAKFFSLFTGGYSQINAVNNALNFHAEANHKVAVSQKDVITNAQAVANEIHALTNNALRPLSEEQKGQIQQLHEWGEAEKDIARLTGSHIEAVHLYIETNRKAQEEQKKFNAAMAEMEAVGGDFKKTVEEIDGAVVEGIKYYHDAGISVENLARVYGLTASQVKAVIEVYKEEQRTLKANAEAAVALDKLYTQFYAHRLELIGTDTQKAEAAAEKDYEIHVKELQEKGVTDRTYYDQLWELRGKDIELAETDRLQNDTRTKSHLEKQINDAKDALDLMRRHREQYRDTDIRATEEELVKLREMRDTWGEVGYSIDKDTEKVKTLSGEVLTLKEYEAKQLQGGTQEVSSANFEKALQNYITAGGFNPTGAGITQYRDPFQLARAGYSFQEIIEYAFNKDYQGKLPPPKGPKIPGFKYGGEGDFGEGTIVMLHGQERITPIAPGGASAVSNGPINMTFNVNGTAADVARQVSQEIMRTLKSLRQLGAA